MIVLDTNVVSELMRSEPNRVVFAWIASRAREDLYTTSVTCAEVMTGIALLPQGRRRNTLEDLAAALFSKDFSGRILPFDAPAASRYSELVARRRSAGSPISVFDGMIAATASVAGAVVATRDLGGFQGCGLTLVDPWAAA